MAARQALNSLEDLRSFLQTLQVVWIPASKIELGRKPIGECPFGSAWSGRYQGQDVAVKRLRLHPKPDQPLWFVYQSIARELWTLMTIRHLPFVAHLVGIVDNFEADELWLVMELVSGQMLLEVRLPHNHVAWAMGILRLLAHQFVAVHELHVAHVNLTPRNVILTPEGGIHLIDFGLPILTPRIGPAYLPTNALAGGTNGFMAPEQVAITRLLFLVSVRSNNNACVVSWPSRWAQMFL
jgi:non-specific serine/threonine protein kinase